MIGMPEAKEGQALNPSYVIPDREMMVGVPPHLHKYVDYNGVMKEVNEGDETLFLGVITTAMLPENIDNRTILLPNTPSIPSGGAALGWHTEPQNGLFRNAADDYGWYYGSTQVWRVNQGNFYLPAMTQGSVLFAGASGLVTQDNTNLFFDDTANYLGIGINASLAARLHISDSHATTTPLIILNQASTGDTGVRYSIGTTNSFITGIDNSDSDSWKLSYAASGAAVLGTGDIVTVTTGGNVGINTTGPDRKLDILDTNAQLRLTRTDGTAYVEFEANASGNMLVTPTGTAIILQKTVTANELDWQVINNGTASTDSARFYIRTNGATAGDPWVQLVVNAVTNWTIGVDNSDSDSLKIGPNAAVGTSTACAITTGNLVTWSISNTATTPHHNLIQSSTGDSALRWAIGTTNSFAAGIDNSDSDSWKLSYANSGSAVLGTNDYLTVATTGATTVGQWLNVGTATLASAQGDAAFGVTRLWWFDESTGNQYIRGAALAASIYMQNTSSGTGATDGFLVQIDPVSDAYVWNFENRSIYFGQNNSERARVAITEFIFNDPGNDYNTRAEGDNKPNCFLLDASDDEVAIDGRFSLVALTPAQLTADQNDYNPESTATNRSSFWRLSSDAARNVTGIANGLDGRYLILVNVGANNVVLQNENASSTAANRIITGTGADVTLAADDTAILIYDSTTARWRILT